MRGSAARLACVCLVLAVGACNDRPAVPMIGASTERGREAIERHGCVACHVIPGVPGPRSDVGPPLDRMARRAYIAGVVPNLPSEMIRWLVDPPQVAPLTAMPAMGISELEARDIAAFLYTLD
jgi:cytochrome c